MKIKYAPGFKTQAILDSVLSHQKRTDFPEFKTGDTIKVFSKIIEGSKERIQAFEGVVVKRQGKKSIGATFTVRKVSANVGVDRTFLFHSPRIEKIEVIARGIVRRSRIFYIRKLRGKAARIKSNFESARVSSKNSANKSVPQVNAPSAETDAIS
jgi:large subunit ribosomal protein L19